MTHRAALCAGFLTGAGYGDWRRAPLAGDASNRRYDRLFDPQGKSVVLMDAPPDRGEDVRPFVRIAQHLQNLGLSAPAILAQDCENGFLLVEDLGDALFAKILRTDPIQEQNLYRLATDTLIALHQHPPPPGLPQFKPPFGADFIAIAYGWYLPGAAGHIPKTAAPFTAALNAALLAHCDDQSVMILRDFHAENLLLLPNRSGVAQVGLLDFQDAMAGHPAYDLISMLTDARRDVSPETHGAMIDHYINVTGQESAAFRSACAVLSVQRNLRILGVFARLCLAIGKAHYIDRIPRVWAHLLRDLTDPALRDLRALVLANLPAPTPDHLNYLRAKCATIPMP